MELLDACLEKNVRLVDYEKMCDETGKNKSSSGSSNNIRSIYIMEVRYSNILL